METRNPTAPEVAERFASLLHGCIGVEKFRSVVATNCTPEYRECGSCASHDYCDANMVMLSAFESFGVDADAVTDCFGEDGDRCGHARTWAEAWDLFVFGCNTHGYPALCA